jgi:hypothetical protein
MIDNETDAMLRAHEAALEGRMERDLADLARLERIRKHPKLCWLVELLAGEADDRRPFVAGGNAPVTADLLALLDEAIALLEARS